MASAVRAAFFGPTFSASATASSSSRKGVLLPTRLTSPRCEQPRGAVSFVGYPAALAIFDENSARLYKFQRSGELSEPRGSPTIDGTAREDGRSLHWCGSP